MAIRDERLDVHKELMAGLLGALDEMGMERYSMTYGRALRATALSLYSRKEDARALHADVNWLLKAQKNGAYTYAEMTDATGWDNSNAQYGLLGVWSGAEAGIEVPQAYWAAVEKHWTDCQG